MDFQNVTWAFERLTGGRVYGYAWNTDTGTELANADGADKVEAGKRLYATLARWAKARPGATLTSRNGDRLTPAGPLHQATGELSNSL